MLSMESDLIAVDGDPLRDIGSHRPDCILGDAGPALTAHSTAAGSAMASIVVFTGDSSRDVGQRSGHYSPLEARCSGRRICTPTRWHVLGRRGMMAAAS